MAAPRELTDSALDCALHGAPDPKHGWRDHLPPENLGAMVDSGSGQIGLQGIIALLWYGKGAERQRATRTLQNYARLCPTRFMLSEPWSLIYGKAIICCWLAVVIIAERIGERDLARSFRALLSTWAGTCALMESNGKVLAAGCRCWGHKVTAGGWDDLWAWAKGTAEPPRLGSKDYGKVGDLKDWGWRKRCARIGLLALQAEASPFLGRDWRSLVPSIPRWGARTEMQLLGWADGSRLWIMGDNETELQGKGDPQFDDDEDQNSNTPGFLAAGVLGGKIVALPKWPNPIDGKERIRQMAVRADIDGHPNFGWTLFHSHLGEKKIGEGYTTHLPPYTASPLVFWQLCPVSSAVWKDMLATRAALPTIPPPTVTANTLNTPVTAEHETFLQKLWRLLRGGR